MGKNWDYYLFRRRTEAWLEEMDTEFSPWFGFIIAVVVLLALLVWGFG